MRKILYLLIMFLPAIVFADYFDVQFLSVTQDTHTAITTDWNYRGNIYFVSGSTSTAPLIADCTAYVTIYATGTIIALDFFGDGSGLTGTGDNLGNHIATTTLIMSGYNLSVSSIIALSGTVNFDDDNLTTQGVGYIPWYSDTESNLKALTPSATYIFYIDTTNNQTVISTGSVNAGSFSQIEDFTTKPTGW